ncbi:methylglutaconyl-CoA hydratase, mitochondrial-like isoform X2 [Symsagittifera roscoffensis]|uniref:methylglutaconyl-CoA hydratase, mitochondrial-like isoform X2 n=1 Tax=Symsagittifera roscoffensis TaxID=84072 RepID=UPI00307B83E2
MACQRYAHLLHSRLASSSVDYLTKVQVHNNDKTAVLTLGRAVAKNAINRQMVESLERCLKELAKKRSLTSLIVRSEVPGVFCAGADLKERANMPESEVAVFVAKIRALLLLLYHFPVPTLAAIDGVALGGGLELGLCCDLRVASIQSKLGLVETKLGIIPGGGGTQTLPRVVGLTKAKELIFTGRIVTGTEAKEMGLVDYVVDSDQVDATALSLSQQMGLRGPVALRMAKRAINQSAQGPIEQGMKIEQECYAQAKELIFTGRIVTATEAKEMGLVDYVVDSDQVDATALSLSQQMGLRGPVALRMAKRAINQSAQGPIEQGMKIEQEYYAQVIPTKDRLEGLQAFREKRNPVFIGE